MTSKPESRMEHAETEARRAADEIAATRSEHERVREPEESRRHEKDYPTMESGERRLGVLESIKEGAKSLVGVVTGRTQETAYKTSEKTEETKDAAMEKASEAKDTTTQKAGQTKDAAMEKAREAKDTTAQKAGETKDAAMETKDAVMEKAGEYKDYTAEKAKEAKDKTMETAKEAENRTIEKAKETTDTGAEKAKEMAESAKQKMEEYKDAAADAAGKARDYLAGTGEVTKEKLAEAQERAKEKMADAERAKDYETEKGRDERGGGGGILGAIGSVTETLKEKLAVSREEDSPEGGERKVTIVEDRDDDKGDVLIRVKEADLSTGTYLNEPGKKGGEGTGPPSLRTDDRHGKI